jgi:hypothetical protein
MSRERRSWPRYPVEFPVQVWVPAHTRNAEAHVGTASNISRNSIQFSCDAELVTALLQQRTLPYTCELAFTLPKQQREFKLVAQVVTHRRVSRHLYVLVLVLLHEDKQQEQELD